MKDTFFQPKFVGARFEEHTLPLDVAKDLAAYEKLVIELAKHLYLQDHPARKRVPKQFSANFHLHLEKIDEGSSRPLLSVVAIGAALCLGGEGDDYFKNARDLVAECVAAEEGSLPEKFPKELLTHFNQFGRSLREGEQMLFQDNDLNEIARLTPNRRKQLVLAAGTEYEKEVELIGSIEEADWEKSTFRLGRPDQKPIIIPMPETFHSKARELGGRHRHLLLVKGVGVFDSRDELLRIQSIENIEIQMDYGIAARFDQLRDLKNGWFDGEGTAPDAERLDMVAEALIGSYPENLPIPAIVPTPEGNLLFEWESPGDPSLDINLEDLTAEFHAFDIDFQDIDKSFDLQDDSSWRELFTFIRRHVSHQL